MVTAEHRGYALTCRAAVGVIAGLAKLQSSRVREFRRMKSLSVRKRCTGPSPIGSLETEAGQRAWRCLCGNDRRVRLPESIANPLFNTSIYESGENDMRICKTPLMLSVIAGAVAFTGTAASAATAMDHFNGYGTVQKDLLGSTGSEIAGWAGPWATNAASDYHPGIQLNYNAPGYSNAPNFNGPADGTSGANFGGGISASAVATRSFTTGLTGTIWVSALAQYTNSNTEGNVGVAIRCCGSTVASMTGRLRSLPFAGSPVTKPAQRPIFATTAERAPSPGRSRSTRRTSCWPASR